MAGTSSDSVVREVRRLFNFGAVGTMSDAQLLDRFFSRRDDAAEAAFEELVIRHGPMVLRVCRSVLHDLHDAEDAVQAVFLVLANRGETMRRRGSVASWLFGVAHRVAHRSKRSSARRRRLDQVVAERASESYLSAQNDPDWEILHDEINRLPERLRAPVVLCHLQGLTYAAAARQLGLSEMALRGRLARARAQLHQRLTRRGVTVPSGLLVAGAAGQAQVPIPVALIQSTTRIALGFIAGNTVATLARGVVNSMLMDQLKVATVLLCLGIGGGYWAWHAFASAVDETGRETIRKRQPEGGQSHFAPQTAQNRDSPRPFSDRFQANPGQAVARAPTSPQPPRTDRYGDPLPRGAVMRLGTVRFRQAPFIRHVVYSPDGQIVVTDSGQYRLLVWDARDGRKLREIDLGIKGIGDFIFSPDGRTIAAVGFQLEHTRDAVVNHLTFTDVATGRLVRRGEWDDQHSVYRVAYIRDAKIVATVSLDGTLRIWDVATVKLLRRERLIAEGNLSPESIAFAPGAASHLFAIAQRQTIYLWDVAQLRRARSIAMEGRYHPDCVVFSPDGTTLAAGVASVGEDIRLWRVGDGTLIRRFKSRKNTQVNHMAFSRDGRVLVAVGGEVVFFDTATGKELDSLGKEFSFGKGFDLLVDSFSADKPLAFSPDGTTLAATGDVQSLHFWDLAAGKDRLATPEAHLGDVVALACLPDGKTLISGSRDRTARVWDLTTGRPTQMLLHGHWVDSLSVSPDGSLLATGSDYREWGRVRVWNPKTGELIHSWSVAGANGSSHLLRGVSLTADSSAVIAALGDGSLRKWDLARGKVRPIPQPKLEKLPRKGMEGLDDVDRAVFSPDGRFAALIGEGWVQVFDIASGDRRFKEAMQGFWSRKLCEFAPDGRSLAIVREERKGFQAGTSRGSSSVASTIVWLDSQTGHLRREFVIPESGVLSLAFSPDGQNIAAGTVLRDKQGIIRIFRLRDKREIQMIESPCPWIEALAFTPDGKRIVAGLRDTSIVIWNVVPGR
jgi:RNA polymerase sigma factor (sigma-70 family)